MRVRFDPRASGDLDQIFAWIAKDSPRSASNMVARIEAKVMQLEAPGFSYMGRPGFIEGTRELVEPPYIIVYKVDEHDEEIVIVSIVHGARDREHRGRKR